MSRIKNRPHDEKAAAADFRRILTGTESDLDHYVESFRALISLGQDLWITCPAWLNTEANMADPEKSKLLLPHLMVVRQYHETVLAGIRRLLIVRNKTAEIRRRIKTTRDIFELNQEFQAEVMSYLFTMPSQISESVLQLEVLREHYRDSLTANLPEPFVKRLFSFLDEAAKASTELLPSSKQLGELGELIDQTAAAAAGISVAVAGGQVMEHVEGEGVVIPPVEPKESIETCASDSGLAGFAEVAPAPEAVPAQ